MSTVNRKMRLPAYGRELMEARKRGEIPALGYSIAVGDWSRGVTGRCVVPDDTDIEALDFSFAAGSDVCVIANEDNPKAREVLNRALKFDPSRLIFLVNEKIDWIKSKKHGIEVQP